MIEATCNGCGSKHALGSRPATEWGHTTECPSCGDTSYQTAYNGSTITEPDRIRAIAREADGVGQQTAEHVADWAISVRSIAEASVAELSCIDGVGQQNGQALKRVAEAHC